MGFAKRRRGAAGGEYQLSYSSFYIHFPITNIADFTNGELKVLALQWDRGGGKREAARRVGLKVDRFHKNTTMGMIADRRGFVEAAISHRALARRAGRHVATVRRWLRRLSRRRIDSGEQRGARLMDTIEQTRTDSNGARRRIRNVYRIRVVPDGCSCSVGAPAAGSAPAADASAAAPAAGSAPAAVVHAAAALVSGCGGERSGGIDERKLAAIKAEIRAMRGEQAAGSAPVGGRSPPW